MTARSVRRWSAPDPDAAPDSFAAIRRDLDIITNALAAFIDELPNKVKQLVETRMKASQAEVHAKIAEALGELRGELKGCLAELRDATGAQARKADDFKFAGERAENDDEPIDLPSWRTGHNVIN